MPESISAFLGGIPRLTQVFGLYRILRRMYYVNLMARKDMDKVTEELADDLYQKIYEDISIPMLGISPKDHFYELKKLGFPFRIKGKGALATGGIKEVQIHTVTGALRDALKIERSEQKDRIVYRVGFDKSVYPWVEYLIKGTSTMMPRDVISSNLRDVRKKAKGEYKAVERSITAIG